MLGVLVQLVLALSGCAQVGARLAPDDSAETAVLEREGERRVAYTRLDSASVAALLSATYIAPSSEHPCCFHDRAQAIQAVTKHRDASDPHPIDSIRSDSVRVRIYGTVAVVTGIETIEMTYTQRQPPRNVTVRMLATNIWVYEQGRWMLIGQQRTLID